MHLSKISAGLLALLLMPCGARAEEKTTEPVRAVWLWGSTVYAYGADRVMSILKESGITDVFLLTKGTAGTIAYKKNTLSAAPLQYYNRDILEETVTAAHQNGIRVHAWLCSLYDENYARRHPEQSRFHFTKGRQSAAVDMPYVNPDSAEYLSYMQNIVTEILKGYSVDGIHLDYIRFNHMVSGWSDEDRKALMAPIDEGGYGLSLDDYNGLVTSLAKTCGYAVGADENGMLRSERFLPADAAITKYTEDGQSIFHAYDAGEKGVVAFAARRAKLVQGFASALCKAARAERPNIVCSAAYMPETADVTRLNFAHVHYGQDMALAAGIFDLMVPMTYAKEYGKTGAWQISTAQYATSLGNRVVSGVQAFGNATSASLGDELKGAINSAALGYCLFREAAFNRVFVSAGEDRLTLRFVCCTDDKDLTNARVILPAGYPFERVIACKDGLLDAETEILDDGRILRLSAFKLPRGYHEGSIEVAVSALPKAAPAIIAGQTPTEDVPTQVFFAR